MSDGDVCQEGCGKDATDLSLNKECLHTHSFTLFRKLSPRAAGTLKSVCLPSVYTNCPLPFLSKSRVSCVQQNDLGRLILSQSHSMWQVHQAWPPDKLFLSGRGITHAVLQALS